MRVAEIMMIDGAMSVQVVLARFATDVLTVKPFRHDMGSPVSFLWRLRNAGLADASNVLQAEVEAEQAKAHGLVKPCGSDTPRR